MPLCSFFNSPVFLSVICLPPLGALSGHVGSCSAQVSWTSGQTSLTCFVSCLLSHLKSSFHQSFLFLFLFTLQLMFLPYFSSLKHSLSPLPIKERTLSDWTRKVDFPSNCASKHFCPFVAADKADLLLQNWAFCVSSLFFCSVAPVVLVLHPEP